MSDRKTSETHFDELSSRFLVGLSQRSSRRGVLAKLGKLALGLLGISILPNLPLDRIFKVRAQDECSPLELCGIYGRPCRNGSSAWGTLRSTVCALRMAARTWLCPWIDLHGRRTRRRWRTNTLAIGRFQSTRRHIGRYRSSELRVWSSRTDSLKGAYPAVPSSGTGRLAV